MKNILTQLKNAQSVAMTAAEKQSMRAHLETLVLHAGSATPHIPNHEIPKTTGASKLSPYSGNAFGFNLLVRAAAFTLVGFIIGSATLTFASTNALPGDALYPIKTKVAEAIVRGLSFSVENVARYDASRVQTRLAELQTLKDQGRLSDPTVAAVAESSMTNTFEDYTHSLSVLKDQGREARATEIAQETLGTLPLATAQPALVTASIAIPTANTKMAAKLKASPAPRPTFENSDIDNKLESLSSQLKELSTATVDPSVQIENAIPADQPINKPDVNQLLPDISPNVKEIQNVKENSATIVAPVPSDTPQPVQEKSAASLNATVAPLIDPAAPQQIMLDARDATSVQRP